MATRINTYDPKDIKLIKSRPIFTNFGTGLFDDYVELHVLSGDNVFVDGSRQTPLRKPIIEALMQDPTSQGQEVLRNIQSNRKLIDLESTPEVLKENIIHSYDKQDRWSNKSKVFPFLVEKRCRCLIDDIKDFI